MNISSRIVAAIVLIAIGLAAGLYSHVWLGWLGIGTPVSGTAPATLAAPKAAPAVPVSGVIVEEVSFPRTLNAVGSLRSNESVVVSAEVSGRIAQINFEEGQPVEKGHVLVQLDDAVAQAELAQAQASLALARSRNERSHRLQSAGFVSQEARDDASVEQQVQEAAVTLAQAKLDKTRIVAPFDGVIGLRSVSVGEYVNAGQDIAPLEAVDVLKVDFRLPEKHIGALSVGQRLEIEVDALPNDTFVGEVYAISPVVETGGRSVLVRAAIDNREGRLHPGMFARVHLITRTDDVVVIPEGALSPSGQSQFVFLIEDGKVTQTPVRLGDRRGALVEVIDGLSAGDMVIISGLQRVRDGVSVTLQKEPQTTSEVVEEAARKARELLGSQS